MKDTTELGTRIVEVHNGSSLLLVMQEAVKVTYGDILLK